MREEKAEQERLARLKKQEANNKEAQRLEKERQERDYRTTGGDGQETNGEREIRERTAGSRGSS